MLTSFSAIVPSPVVDLESNLLIQAEDNTSPVSPVVLPQGNLDITGGHGLGVRIVEEEAMCGRHDVPGHQGQS